MAPGAMASRPETRRPRGSPPRAARSSLRPHAAPSNRTLANASCAVAVILSGGAHDVPLTSPSILRHLLDPFGPSRVCLFLRAPLDPDAHKLFVFLLSSRVHVAAVRLGPPRLSQRDHLLAASALHANAPRVLEELQLLEEAQELVEAFEHARGAPFRLVVRARFDAFWSAPVHLARLTRAMEDGIYLAPRGKAFKGLNDRFGMCNSRTARLVYRRASLLRAGGGRSFGIRGMNGEMYLNWTLHHNCIAPIQMPGLPFCLLARRRFKCCLRDTRCARAGVKCRPCADAELRRATSNRSAALSPRWPAEAARLYDHAFPSYAAPRRRAASLESSSVACARVWASVSAAHGLPWAREWGEACALARQPGCRYDANDARWLGRGCVIRAPADGGGSGGGGGGVGGGGGGAAFARGGRCVAADPIAAAGRVVHSDAAAPAAISTPAFSSWRRRFRKKGGGGVPRPAGNGSRACMHPSLPASQACAAAGHGAAWWEDRQPTRHKVTVLTIVKQAAEIIREWVAYHLMVGVHHFYIVVNDCQRAAEAYRQCDKLLPFVEAGAVTLEDSLFTCQPVSRVKVLSAAVSEMARHAQPDDWLLAIDPDEFVVLPSRQRLPAFLAAAIPPAVDSVSLPWRVFGTSFRALPPTRGGLLANFRLRAWLDAPFPVFLALVEAQRAANQIHPFLAKELVRAHALSNATRCKETDAAAHTYRCAHATRWLPLLRGTLLEQSGLRAREARLWINHYAYQSDADWEAKKRRGRPRFGTWYTPRRGKPAALLSAQLDTSALAYVRALAAAAAEWSAHPPRAQRCADELLRADEYFADGAPLRRAAEARAAARRAHGGTPLGLLVNASALRRADANASRLAVVRAAERVYAAVAGASEGKGDAALHAVPRADLELISACVWHDASCKEHSFNSQGSGLLKKPHARGGTDAASKESQSVISHLKDTLLSS
ncbi:hypothetical protein AB1Y20_007667 [Prymnesium parvum]|uniref:DUF7796 domain-containing protein n=1 Tax=Prymnesium parvum TaxID=97485 RepID=A0AB34IYC1_PRYPA